MVASEGVVSPMATQRGYILVRDTSHPRARNGYVFEHIVIAERAMGRHLPLGVVVHHVDGDPAGNRGGNLVVCQDQAYHLLLHRRQRALEACGDPGKVQCWYCREWDVPATMRCRRQQYHHPPCAKAWAQRYRDRLRGDRPKHLEALAVRTTCKHGHPWTPENVRVTPSGDRVCRECERDRGRLKPRKTARRVGQARFHRGRSRRGE